MTKWEYLTVELKPLERRTSFKAVQCDAGCYTEQLNAYGSQGWELVSVLHTSVFRGTTAAVFAMFKRPKP